MRRGEVLPVTDASALQDAGAVLVVFAGLPGSGKSTLARRLAAALGGLYVRIDTIEQALRDTPGRKEPVQEEGYRVAYAVAADNLRLGGIVVADSVNPVRQSRDAWKEVASWRVPSWSRWKRFVPMPRNIAGASRRERPRLPDCGFLPGMRCSHVNTTPGTASTLSLIRHSMRRVFVLKCFSG